MAKEKPLTKTELIATLKGMRLATKDDLKKEIGASERRLILRMGKVRNDLAARIANVALTTPTRTEFEKLKIRS